MVFVILCVTLTSFARGNNESSELEGQVSIAGSSTVYPVSTAVAEEFSKLYPRVIVAVQSTGTGGGFKNFFIPGKTDINNASRKIKQSELEACRENGIEPIELLVATDAITIVVNKEADWVDNLTVEQLAQIWRPNDPAKTWSDLDPSWPDEEIDLYGPTAASGTFDYFTEEIIGESGSSRTDYQKTEQDNTIVTAVAGNEYALGYFGMAYYLENKDKIKALSINGVKPSIQTAMTGEYTPLSRPLFIYVNNNSLEDEVVYEFVKFYCSLLDTKLIKDVGYVPLKTETAEKVRDKIQ